MSGRIKYNENNSRARARAEIRGDNTLAIPTCDNTTKNFLFCLNIVPSPLKLEDLKKIKMRVDAIIIKKEQDLKDTKEAMSRMKPLARELQHLTLEFSHPTIATGMLVDGNSRIRDGINARVADGQYWANINAMIASGNVPEANGGGGRSRRRKKRKTRKTRSKRRKKKQTRKSRR